MHWAKSPLGCGPRLRQDDPSSLKDVIASLHEAVASFGADRISTRTKFMIETINSLKKNRMKTGNVVSSINSEHIIRMQRILGSLNVRGINGGEPLRIRLKDIRTSEKKGKWWTVVADYRDEESGSKNLQQPLFTHAVPTKNISEICDSPAFILQLAKEQGMNTDVRRSIFMTIMSATDYKDARARLFKLHLKKPQELEIPKVLIHCAGAEETYNPYYTMISRLLCAERRLKMAFQFSLWDFLERIDEEPGGDEDNAREAKMSQGLDMTKVVNIAKLYGTLIAEGGLGLHVLKARKNESTHNTEFN